MAYYDENGIEVTEQEFSERKKTITDDGGDTYEFSVNGNIYLEVNRIPPIEVSDESEEE